MSWITVCFDQFLKGVSLNALNQDLICRCCASVRAIFENLYFTR